MAILIQNMSEVVNIIDTTANAGETILHALSKECKVQPIKKDLPNDIIAWGFSGAAARAIALFRME
jgi:hypothetical protein